jgi:hypothetical protein
VVFGRGSAFLREEIWAMRDDGPPRILDHFRELFERGAADRGAKQGLQLGGIGDQLDSFAQALRFKE